MSSHIRLIIAAAIVVVLCQAAVGRSEATVVRDGDAGPFNPAVDTGGHPLPAKGNDIQVPADVPYSLIDALRTEYAWFPPCFVWRGSVFSPSHRHRHDVGKRAIGTLQGGAIHRFLRPVP